MIFQNWVIIWLVVLIVIVWSDSIRLRRKLSRTEVWIWDDPTRGDKNIIVFQVRIFNRLFRYLPVVLNRGEDIHARLLHEFIEELKDIRNTIGEDEE